MTGVKVIGVDLANFELQSFSDEMFSLNNFVAHTPWQDDVDTLPHKLDVSSYRHFQDTDLLHLPVNDSVDSLISNDKAFLMTLLE